MQRFPRTSVQWPGSEVETVFHAGLGYHVPSHPSKALCSRLSALTAEEELLTGTVYSSHNAGGNAHVATLISGNTIMKHSVLNVERGVMYDIDQFLVSAELALDPVCYESLVSTATGGRVRSRFNRVPFQQFMLMDSLMTMVDRSGLAEHKPLILQHLKHALGYAWLTPSKADAIVRLLSSRVVGHSVRRRMGKSVAVYSDLARCLAFFPRAGIRALYTVHRAAASDECHAVVAGAVVRFVALFNAKQRESYERRISARGGDVDPRDFFYIASCVVAHKKATVHVHYHQLNGKGDMNGGLPVSRNTLRCKAYTQQDVSSSFCFIVLCFCFFVFRREGGGVAHLERWFGRPDRDVIAGIIFSSKYTSSRVPRSRGAGIFTHFVGGRKGWVMYTVPATVSKKHNILNPSLGGPTLSAMALSTKVCTCNSPAGSKSTRRVPNNVSLVCKAWSPSVS